MVPDPGLGRELAKARVRTDELFGFVRPDDIHIRPIPERNRIIFYLGHMEAFDWNLIGRYALGMQSFHPTFDNLFAFGIDPPAGELPNDQPSDWPAVEEIEQYNARVRQTIDDSLPHVPEQLVHVAIEHRLMHAETLAYMVHNLPLERKPPPVFPPSPSGPSPENPMIEIPAGLATLGRRRGNGFGWDNEFDQHTVSVPAFEISKYKITNGQYLDFVRDGGEAPNFWARRGDEWLQRRMFDRVPLHLDRPVYVTHQQASAYAAWAGKSLPTEAQFHRAAYGTLSGEERQYPWGDTLANASNFDFRRWNPMAVNGTPAGDSAFGAAQLVGNGWEWTSTVFEPFPGFEPFPFYPGYSANFFDGGHYVLKGASPRTAACFLRRSFRNWFRPGYPYLYATFRLVS